jgi:hypothetical protein
MVNAVGEGVFVAVEVYVGTRVYSRVGKEGSVLVGVKVSVGTGIAVAEGDWVPVPVTVGDFGRGKLVREGVRVHGAVFEGVKVGVIVGD